MNEHKNPYERAANIRLGCLPPGMPLSVDELQRKIHTYSSQQLEEYNASNFGLTTCEAPYHILGFTSDGKCAYYGLNYLGSEDPFVLRESLEKTVKDAGDELTLAIATQAKKEFELLFPPILEKRC
ncbi:MAG: hypothetical protein AABX72_01790 [Nanoarchaeota archaeon]